MSTRATRRRAGSGLPAGLDTSCRECLLFEAIQGLADGFVLVDREGRIVHLNRRAEEQLDVRSARVVGRQIWLALPHSSLIAFWHAAVDHQFPVTGDLAFAPATTLRATASACRSVAGRSVGMAILLRDLGREKRGKIEGSAASARRSAK